MSNTTIPTTTYSPPSFDSDIYIVGLIILTIVFTAFIVFRICIYLKQRQSTSASGNAGANSSNASNSAAENIARVAAVNEAFSRDTIRTITPPPKYSDLFAPDGAPRPGTEGNASNSVGINASHDVLPSYDEWRASASI